METVFEKILKKELPAHIEYEDEQCLAFKDIAPQAPIHFLIIPKRKIERIDEASVKDKALLGHLLLIASQLGKQFAPNGYRIVLNNGKDGSETVHYLHVHLLGGRSLLWPPG